MYGCSYRYKWSNQTQDFLYNDAVKLYQRKILGRFVDNEMKSCCKEVFVAWQRCHLPAFAWTDLSKRKPQSEKSVFWRRFQPGAPYIGQRGRIASASSLEFVFLPHSSRASGALKTPAKYQQLISCGTLFETRCINTGPPNDLMQLSCPRLVFGRCLVRISTGSFAALTGLFVLNFKLPS